MANKKLYSRTHSNLPKRPASHVIGDQALLSLRNAIPEKWIFREASSDYGIDCEIEVVSDYGSVTGAIIKGQVKGTASAVAVQKGGLTVSTNSVRYWLALPVPVIIVRVTQNPDNVLWVNIREYLQNEDRLDSIYRTTRKTTFFNFRDAYSLPDDSEILKDFAIRHQSSVAELLQAGDADPDVGAQYIGHVLLMTLFDGDPDKWIQWLREKGTIEQLVEDLPFVVWIKEQAERDPDFLRRVKKMVDDTVEKAI